MSNVRLPRAVCAAAAGVLVGSHDTLNALFEPCGAPAPPPNLSHATKWKEWLYRAGRDPNVDSLTVLGGILEEFMDCGPNEGSEAFAQWKANRERVVRVLEENGFQYFRGGRILPTGQTPEEIKLLAPVVSSVKPTEIAELLEILLRGLRRAASVFHECDIKTVIDPRSGTNPKTASRPPAWKETTMGFSDPPKNPSRSPDEEADRTLSSSGFEVASTDQIGPTPVKKTPGYSYRAGKSDTPHWNAAA